MSDYDYLRKAYRDASGTLTFAATDTTTTLETAKSTAYTIFIQHITVYIKTDAAQTITFNDSAASPLELAKTDSSPGAGTIYQFPFPGHGFPLTLGKNLVATFSAAGLAGNIEWVGYQRIV